MRASPVRHEKSTGAGSPLMQSVPSHRFRFRKGPNLNNVVMEKKGMKHGKRDLVCLLLLLVVMALCLRSWARAPASLGVTAYFEHAIRTSPRWDG
jgi:hypothetical protein